ncbi:hypothetical protein FISHEDRAFT_52602, partial [Fistulina hepatica ATCC 64428]
SKARGFLDMMVRGHPDYGCFISRDKTLTNFDFDEQVLNVMQPSQRSKEHTAFPAFVSNICLQLFLGAGI